MQLSELKIGQWYKSTAYPDYPFMPLVIDFNQIQDSVYFNGAPERFLQGQKVISNEQFWKTAQEVSFDDLPAEYQKYVPEEFRKPLEYNPLIFN